MRKHTNNFANAINTNGRQMRGKIRYYNYFNFILEDGSNLITEDEIYIKTEQINNEDFEEIQASDIYSMDIIKNGNLFQSLMKEFDFTTKIELPIGTTVNPFLGILINDETNEYEFLDYKNFIIKEKNYDFKTQLWSYICYDKMLLFMKQYKPLNISYPTTIGDFLIKMCEHIGVEYTEWIAPYDGWLNFTTVQSSSFDQPLKKELFANKNITYRDILDKIAIIFGGTILISDNDKLVVVTLYQYTKRGELTKKEFKEINADFKEANLAFNKVSILDSESKIEFVSQNNDYINRYGLFEYKIVDNEFAFNGNTQQLADRLLSQFGLAFANISYYFYDLKTTGICFLDYLDRFYYRDGNKEYNCFVMNNEISITQGIEELMYHQEITAETKNTDNFITSVSSAKETSLKIDKQQSEISSKVSKNGIISAINQSAEEIQIQANKIKLEGYTTINDGFSIDEEGNMIANNGTFNGLISSGNIEVGNGYTEANPYLAIGNLDDGMAPYGVYAWDNGVSVIDYRGNGYFPLIRTEQAGGGYAQLKGNACEAFAFNNVSLAEKKKDFELLKSGLEILKNIDIYKYYYKGSSDKKKKIGVVIGDKYKYSKEITSEDNTEIDLYSFIAVCCKAIQEQQEEINKLKEMIKNGKY